MGGHIFSIIILIIAFYLFIFIFRDTWHLHSTKAQSTLPAIVEMTIIIPNNNVDCDRLFGGPLTADNSRSSGEQSSGRRGEAGNEWRPVGMAVALMLGLAVGSGNLYTRNLGAWDRPAREPQAWELAVGSTALVSR